MTSTKDLNKFLKKELVAKYQNLENAVAQLQANSNARDSDYISKIARMESDKLIQTSKYNNLLNDYKAVSDAPVKTVTIEVPRKLNWVQRIFNW